MMLLKLKKLRLLIGNNMFWDSTPKEVVRRVRKDNIGDIVHLMNVYKDTKTLAKWRSNPKAAMEKEIMAIIYFSSEKRLMRLTGGTDSSTGGQMEFNFAKR